MSEAVESTPSVEAPVVESQESGAQEAQSQAEVKEAARKFKLKVDGREEELGEEEVIRYASMGKAANKRFQEAAKMRQEAEQFVSLLKRDPIKALSDPKIGHDFRQLAEQYLSQQLEQEMMSPEQRKAREMEQKLREYEDRERQEVETKREQEMRSLEDKYAEGFTKTITDALSMGGVPKTPKTVKRMAELMHKNLQHGFELEPKHLIEMVREDYLAEIKELFGASDGDTLLGLLGDENAGKIRKADLKRLKSNPNPFERKAQGPARQDAPQKVKGIQDFRAEMARIKRGEA